MEDEIDVLARVGFFVLLVWLCGRLFARINAQLIGEIVAGIILRVIGWLPPKEFIFVMGNLGLVLLVMEGGLSIRPNLLPQIGLRAVVIAITGAILPVFLGWGFMKMFGKGKIESITAGAALSSTSIGMISKMLQDSGQLHTRLGNLITVSAVVDDIAALVILAFLERLGDSRSHSDENESGSHTGYNDNRTSTVSFTSTVISTQEKGGDDGGTSIDPWQLAEPAVVSIGFVLFGMVMIKLLPKIDSLIPWRGTSDRKIATIALLLLLSWGLVVVAGVTGTSFLLGSFTAGMAFANVRDAKLYWIELNPIAELFSSAFFAGIGLTIPIAALFDPIPLGYGLIYTFPAIVGKYITGFIVGDILRGNVVGCAMVGRGELGFLMAEEALEDDLIGDDTFISCVWALLLCTVLSPLALRWALERLRKAHGYTIGEHTSGGDEGGDALGEDDQDTLLQDVNTQSEDRFSDAGANEIKEQRAEPKEQSHEYVVNNREVIADKENMGMMPTTPSTSDSFDVELTQGDEAHSG